MKEKWRRLTIIKKIGTLDNGKYLCAIGEQDWERLQRREGTRKNVAQRTASIRTILAKIEEVFGLPGGCVRFYKPDGRSAYNRNTKIKRILKDYEMS